MQHWAGVTWLLSLLGRWPRKNVTHLLHSRCFGRELKGWPLGPQKKESSILDTTGVLWHCVQILSVMAGFGC